MAPLRIFISSVQKELELERAAVAGLITTDPFLLQHCVPVLFEKEPPAARPNPRGYLTTLRGCALYVLMVANEYGQPDGELSPTHLEYREAQRLKLPTIVFLKGHKDETRSEGMRVLIAEAKKDGFKYVRFHDREDLKPAMLDALRRALAEEYDLKATPAEVAEGRQQIEAASAFEAGVLPEVPIASLDKALVSHFNHETAANKVEQIFRLDGMALVSRGLAVRSGIPPTVHPTVAAFLLFGARPADRFPQCEILVDAYDDVRIGGRPKGQTTINASLPHALAQVLEFIDAHTFHPRRVVGLNNLRLDEYPVAALREALVNAVAHRTYDDRARKVLVRVYSDRVEIANPGYPPQPLTLAKLRKGGYIPCSRNPLIAQTLATLGLMEQRGSGFARMRDAMLNHGLEAPTLSQQDGFFVVTLPGPAGNYERLKVPAGVSGPITPAVEALLNPRQKRLAALLATGERLTSRFCEKEFEVTRDTAARDFGLLVDLGIAIRTGRGRSVSYIQRPPA